MSHCCAHRPYEDRLRTLLLLLQLMEGQSSFYGGSVRNARVQRYGSLFSPDFTLEVPLSQSQIISL